MRHSHPHQHPSNKLVKKTRSFTHICNQHACGYFFSPCAPTWRRSCTCTITSWTSAGMVSLMVSQLTSSGLKERNKSSPNLRDIRAHDNPAFSSGIHGCGCDISSAHRVGGSGCPAVSAQSVALQNRIICERHLSTADSSFNAGQKEGKGERERGKAEAPAPPFPWLPFEMSRVYGKGALFSAARRESGNKRCVRTTHSSSLFLPSFCAFFFLLSHTI